MAMSTPPPLYGGGTAQMRFGGAPMRTGLGRPTMRGAGGMRPFGQMVPPEPPDPITPPRPPSKQEPKIPRRFDPPREAWPMELAPYADLPDFAGRTVNVSALDAGRAFPGQSTAFDNQGNLRAMLLAQMQAGGYGHLPSHQRVQGMQDTANNIRGMGGVKWGQNAGQARGGIASSREETDPMLQAVRMRRMGATQKGMAY